MKPYGDRIKTVWGPYEDRTGPTIWMECRGTVWGTVCPTVWRPYETVWGPYKTTKNDRMVDRMETVWWTVRSRGGMWDRMETVWWTVWGTVWSASEKEDRMRTVWWTVWRRYLVYTVSIRSPYGLHTVSPHTVFIRSPYGFIRSPYGLPYGPPYGPPYSCMPRTPHVAPTVWRPYGDPIWTV